MPYLLPLAPERNPTTRGPEAGHNAGLPSGLDPVRCPIIARHVFGWQPVGEVAAWLVLRKLPDLLNEACDG